LPKHRLLLIWGVIGVLFLLLVTGCQNMLPGTETPAPAADTQVVTNTDPGQPTENFQLPSASAELTLTPGSSSTPLPPSQTPIQGTSTVTPTVTITLTNTIIPTATRFSLPTWTSIPSSTPRISPTPTPPTAYLRILQPGPYSKINSPLNVEAGAIPGDDGLVLVDLIGESGQPIARQRLDFSEFIGRSIGIAPKLEFKIAGVAETARLVLSVEDNFGRKIAITSIEVVLLSIGDNQIYPSGYQAAPYIIQDPVADQIIQGGVLNVSGLARIVNLTPIIFEIIDEQGQVIASNQLQVPLPAGDQSHTPFSIDIPYKVTIPTRVRLTIRQASGDRIPGTVALWSVPVLLLP